MAEEQFEGNENEIGVDLNGHFKLLDGEEEEESCEESITLLEQSDSEYSDPFKSDTASIASEEEAVIETDDSAEAGTAESIESTESNLAVLSVNCPLFFESKIQVPLCSTLDELLSQLSQFKPEWTHSSKPLTAQNCQVFLNGELKDDWQSVALSPSTEVTLIHDLSNFSADTEEDIEVEACKADCKEDSKYQKEKKSNSFIKRFRKMFTSTPNAAEQATTLPTLPLHLHQPVIAAPLLELEIFFTDAFTFLSQPDSIQEGLFRLSGTFTRINELQEAIQSGKRLHQLQLDSRKDSHNVAGLVKQTLRKLPTCLLDFTLMPGWREVAKFPAGSAEFKATWSLLFSFLPSINQRLLSGLLELLRGLLPFQEVTRMNASNFGTVIGPNLLFTSAQDDLSGTLETSTLSSQLVTNLLRDDEVDYGGAELKLIALARMEYDLSLENSTDSSDSAGSEDSNLPEEVLQEGSIIFLLPIEESLDGWWPAVRAPSFERRFKVPSNYVSILCQLNKAVN